MITRENYSIEHIMKLHESSKRDPNLIERVLFAFGLLEALRRVEVYIAQRIISVILKELEVWLDIFIRLTIQQKLHLHMHQLLCIWMHV